MMYSRISNSKIYANDLGSKPAKYGIFLTVHGFPQQRLSISISQQLIMTQTMLTVA